VSPHTVFAFERQPVVVEGLKRIFDQARDLRLLGSAPACSEALDAIACLHPDLILLDQAACAQGVFHFITRLKQLPQSGRIVLWADDLVHADCLRAVQLGIRGVLHRAAPAHTLLVCLRSVCRGDLWMDESIQAFTIDHVSPGRPLRLTPREREILGLVCRGLKNKEIARHLAITPGTVKAHLMHVFEKTGFKDRFQLCLHGRGLLEKA